MSLQFYANPLSAWSHKVHLFLEETGIPYRLHKVDLGAGANLREPYRSLNPLGAVPAIEHGGFSLAESGAILRYLAQHYQKTDWYPLNLQDRARVDMMADFANLQVNRWLSVLGWGLHYGPKLFKQPTDERAMASARTNLMRYLGRLEPMLAGRRYLSGPTPTLADVTLLPFVAQHGVAQVALGDYPNLSRWLEHMSARPAWKKVEAETKKMLG